MFVGRSEISKSVIVKDMQHVGIIRVFCLPGKLAKFFSAWGGYKKLMLSNELKFFSSSTYLEDPCS